MMPPRRITPNDFFLSELAKEEQYPDFYQGASGTNSIEKNLDPNYGSPDRPDPIQDQEFADEGRPSEFNWKEMLLGPPEAPTALGNTITGARALSEVAGYARKPVDVASNYYTGGKLQRDVLQGKPSIPIPDLAVAASGLDPKLQGGDDSYLKAAGRAGVKTISGMATDPTLALELAAPSSVVGKGLLGATLPGAALGTFDASKAGIENYEKEGFTPETLEHGLDAAASLGMGVLAAHQIGGKGLDVGVDPSKIHITAEDLPLQYDPTKLGSLGGGFKINPKYLGQEVEILGRRGNSVKIKLPDGSEKTVGFSQLEKQAPKAEISQEAPKSKYTDITKELEEMLGEDVNPEIKSEETPTINPQDVSVVKPKELSSFARIDGKQVELTPEQKSAWDKANEDYQGSLRIANQKFLDPEQAAKQKKAAGIRFSVEKRRILGQKSVRAGGPEKVSSSLEDTPFIEDVSVVAEPEPEIVTQPKMVQGQIVTQQPTKPAFQGPIKPIKELSNRGGKGNKPPSEPPDNSRYGKGGPKEESGPAKPKGAEWLLDLWRAPSSLKYSLDVPTLSRSLLDTVAHPIKAAKETGQGLKSAVSPEHYEKTLKQIQDRPNYENSIKAGVAYTKEGYDPGAQAFGSYSAENIPIAGQVVKASERAQNVKLDLAKARIFDDLTKGFKPFEEDPQSWKRAADIANVSTGHGRFDNKTGENIIKGLNQVFTVRLQVSRLKHIGMIAESLIPNKLLPQAAKLPMSVRKELWRQAGPTVALGIAGLELAKSMGATVSYDPRDSNSFKAIFTQPDGKKVVWGPFAQYQGPVRIVTQMLSGTKVSNDKEFDLTKPKNKYSPTRGSELGEYAHNRMFPSFRYAWDKFSPDIKALERGKSKFVDKDNPLAEGLGLIEPINIGVLKDLYDVLGPVGALGNLGPITLGANVDVYDNVQPLGINLNPRANYNPYRKKK